MPGPSTLRRLRGAATARRVDRVLAAPDPALADDPGRSRARPGARALRALVILLLLALLGAAAWWLLAPVAVLAWLCVHSS
ncbi:MAG: hypothetical protein ACTMIR_12975, partial [Cellulomonadaceae bacterium]